MVVGAVAQVLYEVLVVDVALHAHPQRAFAAHLAQADVGTDLFLRASHRQCRAADPDTNQRALGHHGRAVVRATRAKIGRAVGQRKYVDRGPKRSMLVEPATGRCDFDVREYAWCYRRGDDAGWKVGVRSQQFRPIGAAFAINPGGVRDAVEEILDRQLDECALLLDHHNLIQALRELLHDVRLQRRHHAQLENPDARRSQVHCCDAQGGQRLVQVQIGHARDHETDHCAAVAFDPIQAVGARVAPSQFGAHRHQAALDLSRLLLVHEVRRDHVPIGLSVERVVGNDGAHLLLAHGHRTAAIHQVGGQFHATPQARKAGQRDGMQAQVHDLLRVARREHGHSLLGHGNFGAARDCRRLRDDIVADQHQRTAGRRGTTAAGVAQRIGGAIESGRLAVPDSHYAIVAEFAEVLRQLRALDRCGGQFLVQARHECDLVRVQQFLLATELEIERAQRRARVA